MGLEIPLNNFDVIDIVEGRTSRIQIQSPGWESHALWVKELDLEKDYAACVATVGLEDTVVVITH